MTYAIGNIVVDLKKISAMLPIEGKDRNTLCRKIIVESNIVEITLTAKKGQFVVEANGFMNKNFADQSRQSFELLERHWRAEIDNV